MAKSFKNANGTEVDTNITQFFSAPTPEAPANQTAGTDRAPEAPEQITPPPCPDEAPKAPQEDTRTLTLTREELNILKEAAVKKAIKRQKRVRFRTMEDHGEPRSQHVNLMVKPSLKEAAQDVAAELGISLNNAIERALIQFVKTKGFTE